MMEGSYGKRLNLDIALVWITLKNKRLRK